MIEFDFDELREDYLAALRAGFEPQPDEAIVDEDERAARHQETLRRVAVHREAAVRDVIRRHAARVVSIRIGELWKAGCYKRDFNEGPVLVHAQQLLSHGTALGMLEAAAVYATVAAVRLARNKE